MPDSSCRTLPCGPAWGSPRAREEMEAGRCRNPGRKRRSGAHGSCWRRPRLGPCSSRFPRATHRLVCPAGRDFQARLVARTVPEAPKHIFQRTYGPEAIPSWDRGVFTFPAEDGLRGPE